MKKQLTLRKVALTSGILLLAATAPILYYCGSDEQAPTQTAGGATATAPAQMPPTITPEQKRAIANAQERVNRRLDACATELGRIVRGWKSGSRAFAEEVTGYTAVGKYVSGGLEDYVAAEFDEHVISSRQMQQQLGNCVERALGDIRDIEDELVLELCSHVESGDVKPSPIRTELLRKEMVSELKEIGANAATTTIGSFIASEAGCIALRPVTSAIISRIITMLGTRGALMGASASGSVCSWGLTLVVGLGVDYLVEWAMDNEGEIEQEVNTALDQMAKSVELEFRSQVQQGNMHSLAPQWEEAFLASLTQD